MCRVLRVDNSVWTEFGWDRVRVIWHPRRVRFHSTLFPRKALSSRKAPRESSPASSVVCSPRAPRSRFRKGRGWWVRADFRQHDERPYGAHTIDDVDADVEDPILVGIRDEVIGSPKQGRRRNDFVDERFPSERLRYARQWDLGDGKRRIVLLTDRYISFNEAVVRPRTRDYTMSLIVMDVDSEGNGEGQLAMAVQLSVDQENKTLVVENYGTYTVRLTNVRRRD